MPELTVQLRDLLVKHFGLSDLRSLCDDLGVDWEEIPEGEKSIRVIELIKRLARHDRLPELVDRAKALRPNVAWPAVWTAPAGSRFPHNSNPFFIGRQPELAAITQHLHLNETHHRPGEAARTPAESIVALTGLGGIGKTQLAAQWVRQASPLFLGGVFWLSFATPANIPNEIAACGGAQAMALPGFENLPQPQQVQRVLDEWRKPLPRLLVFDNCEDENLLRQWLPRQGGCRVLLTSRKDTWPKNLLTSLPLPALLRPQSIALLQKHRPTLTHDEAAAIAQELEDLPLALHLAGSYLENMTEVSAPLYLAKLQQHGLAHPSLVGTAATPSPTAHDLHVQRTFQLSYEQLGMSNEELVMRNDSATPSSLRITHYSLLILWRLAYLAPGEWVPRELWQAIMAADEEEAEGAEGDEEAQQVALSEGLRRLRDLGLIERQEATGALRLHRLLGLFVQGQVRHAGQEPAVLAVVETQVYNKANALDKAGDPRPLAAWLEHLIAVTARATPRRDERAGRLCNALGYHWQMVGAYAAAQGYFEQALAITREVLGERHPSTVTSINNMGAILRAQGELTAAREYHEQALAIRREVLGDRHPDTAASLNNMGYILKQQGKLTAARAYHEQALSIWREVLGERHPNTATSLNNMGYILKAQGELTAARAYYEQALSIRREVLGERHPDTALSLHNLGLLLHDLGEVAAARAHLQEALAIYEAVLGANHPETQSTRDTLAVVLAASSP